MPSSQPAPIEVSAAQLGDRFAAMRLLPPTDPEMAASLRRYGQLTPVVAFRDGQGGAIELIDGFRRQRVAAAQGWPAQLAVRVLDLDGPRALAALMALHQGSSRLSELEEGWVVRALVREHGLVQSDAAQLLRRHQSWVSRRLMLVEALAPEVQADVRLGLCSPTVAREVARLPRGIQEVVARAIARHGMSTRQSAKLVAATERLPAATADEIERAASTVLGSTAGARPCSETDKYAHELEQLERLATRVLARLRAQPRDDGEIGARLRALAPALRAVLDAITCTLEGP